MIEQVTHCLKTWPDVFQSTADGVKTFEYRIEDDRHFSVGDVLVLQEWTPSLEDPSIGTYTGREVRVRVTHLERGPNWGIPKGHVVMSIKPMKPENTP